MTLNLFFPFFLDHLLIFIVKLFIYFFDTNTFIFPLTHPLIYWNINGHINPFKKITIIVSLMFSVTMIIVAKYMPTTCFGSFMPQYKIKNFYPVHFDKTLQEHMKKTILWSVSFVSSFFLFCSLVFFDLHNSILGCFVW